MPFRRTLRRPPWITLGSRVAQGSQSPDRIESRMRSWPQWAFVLSGLVLFVTPARAAGQAVDAARAALPALVRSGGVLRIATSLQWPPFDYTTASGTPDGIDIRLMTLLAAKLGLKPDIEDVKFPSIVPGVASGRFDAGVDEINITAERSKVVAFVPYSRQRIGLLVRKGTAGIDVNDLCGHTLVLTQGSAQVGIAETLSARCVTAGRKPIAFLFYPSSADTYLALANGRGDGFLTARASGLYIARGNDKLAMTDATLAEFATTSGIVVAKGNAAMQQALRRALESAVTDGSYQRVMQDFGVPEEALTVEQIRNPPPV